MTKEAETPIPLIEIVTLDPQRRIDIDSEWLESSLGIKLSPSQSVNLWALIGSKGQFQVLSPENEVAKKRERYVNKKSASPLTWDAGGDQSADTMRKFSGMFRITCNREQARAKIRLTIPSDAIEMGFAKAKGQLIAFISGEIFELWQMEAWRQNCAVADTTEFAKQVSKLID
jgi:hypothetical protein